MHPQLISAGSAELYFGEVRKANEKKNRLTPNCYKYCLQCLGSCVLEIVFMSFVRSESPLMLIRFT